MDLMTLCMVGMLASATVIAWILVRDDRERRAASPAAERRNEEWHACAVRRSELECRKLQAEIDKARRESDRPSGTAA